VIVALIHHAVNGISRSGRLRRNGVSYTSWFYYVSQLSRGAV